MNRPQGMAVWITGLPAAGKSSITRCVVDLLSARNIFPAVLESDRMRAILTPSPSYDREERDRFYLQVALLGEMLTHQGFAVIFDATAHRRDYRDRARSLIPRFCEVYVSCPLDVCEARDPKGIYAAAAGGRLRNVPGVHLPYELANAPELVLDGREPPERGASRIVQKLSELHYI